MARSFDRVKTFDVRVSVQRLEKNLFIASACPKWSSEKAAARSSFSKRCGEGAGRSVKIAVANALKGASKALNPTGALAGFKKKKGRR